AIAKMVSNVFQTRSVSIWLLDEGIVHFRFAASTSLPAARADQLKLSSSEAAELVTAFLKQPDPIDIDASKEGWAAALRRIQPDQFRKPGSRICIPLIAAGEVLGFTTMGDRFEAIPFSVQDFDLLKAIADQAAPCLLNV